ncbi:hypothetical protein [Spirosoma validum]|uniref:Uncharacterized protein n=1 Tax=Spirosoma validum TaxID=2771355 RepID=A0A927GHB7_9BACT|nr:hypothetical protein [Spirosoma validum]MBD2757867.1 hypothetical protein [Spirosoma validum]
MEPEEEYIAKIIRQLENISKHPPVDRQDDWLRFIHQRYTERFLKDNDRIWTVSSIFIPLSLAGLASVKDGNFISTFLLGMGSIVLINFWFNSAEKHRSFQEKSQDVVEAIEKLIGLDTMAIPLKGPGAKYRIRKGRRDVKRLVISIWMVAISLIFIKCIVEAKPAFQKGTLQDDLAKMGKSLLGIKEESAIKSNGKVTIVADSIYP